MVALCLILFVVVIAAKLLMSELLSAQHQWRLVNVNHDARCVMGKVGRQKRKEGNYNLLYIFAVIG